MSYPALKISMRESDVELVNDLEIDEWPNGSARGRAYADAARYRWVLIHPALTETEKGTLEAYWLANKTLPFDFVDRFVSPSVTRNNVMFTERPVFKRNDSPAGNRTYRATVKLRMR